MQPRRRQNERRSRKPRRSRRCQSEGHGLQTRKRVEDARFTQGKGNYVDDIKLARNAALAILFSSPYAHAKDQEHRSSLRRRYGSWPGVLAVLTAADLEPLGLHWMPTLAGDKQMVLADGKVLFQGQEVAYRGRRRIAICRCRCCIEAGCCRLRRTTGSRPTRLRR